MKLVAYTLAVIVAIVNLLGSLKVIPSNPDGIALGNVLLPLWLIVGRLFDDRSRRP